MFYFRSTGESMVGVNLWSGLIHRLFPWRAPLPAGAPVRRARRARRAAGREQAAGIRLARRNAYTGMARFTGRSVDRMFLAAMSRPHRYPGAGDLERVGEEIAGAHALYRNGRPAAPSAFHATPPTLESPSIEPAWHPSMRFEWMSF
jgi:hypothetical protein